MREAEIQFLKEQNELEIARAKQLSEIEVISLVVVVVSWNVLHYYFYNITINPDHKFSMHFWLAFIWFGCRHRPLMGTVYL